MNDCLGMHCDSCMYISEQMFFSACIQLYNLIVTGQGPTIRYAQYAIFHNFTSFTKNRTSFTTFLQSLKDIQLSHKVHLKWCSEFFQFPTIACGDLIRFIVVTHQNGVMLQPLALTWQKIQALCTAMYLSSYTGKLYIQERHIVMSWQCIIYDLCMKYNCHIRIMISLYSLTMIQDHNVIIMVMNLKTNYMAKNQLMSVVIFGSYTEAFKILMLDSHESHIVWIRFVLFSSQRA